MVKVNKINYVYYFKKQYHNALNKNDKRKDRIYYRALRKYGIENFKSEILEYCISKEELNKREIYWISFFKGNNLDFGYNMTIGGDGPKEYTHTDRAKKQISISHIGKSSKLKDKSYIEIYGEEGAIEKTKKMKKSLKGKNKGIKSIETRQKISESLKRFIKENGSPNIGKSYSNKGKTYEEMHGEEKAKELKLNMTGENHPRVDHYLVITPDNISFILKTSSVKFCKENKISWKGFFKVKMGIKTDYKGWKFFKINK